MFQQFNEYQFSQIKLNLLKTGEIFNIGVILQDGDEKRIKLIDSFTKLKNCLGLDNPSGHDFTLEMLYKSFEENSLTYGANFSNSINITKLEWIGSKLSLDEEANTMFESMVTLGRKGRTKNYGEYSSNSIITKIKNLALEKKYTNIEFRKRHDFIKAVDTATLDEDKKIVIAGEVCSPYVDDFLSKFGVSMLLTQQLKTQQKAREVLVYLPIMENLPLTKRNAYNYARTFCDSENIKYIDSANHREFLGVMMNETKKYSQSLL